MDFLDAKKALANELNIDFSNIAQNERFSEDDLAEYINQGAKIVWDRHTWDFTEGQYEGTITSTETTQGYLPYPKFFVLGSIVMLFVDNDEYDKVNYHDYVRMMKQDTDRDSEVFAEYKQNVYINPNNLQSGQDIEAYGKLAFDPFDDDTTLLPFSHSPNIDSSGNDAIVQIAYAEALNSDKLREPEKANNEREKALSKIDRLWKTYADNRAKEAVVRQRFVVPDYFDNNTTPRSSDYIGHFDLE